MRLQGCKTATTLVALSAFVPNLYMVNGAFAQATASDTLNVNASVVNPLAVSPSFTFALDFKTFAIAGTGTYTIQPGGTGTIGGGFTLGGQNAGTAKLNVPQNITFTLSIPTYKSGKSVFLTVAGGGVASKQMTMKSLLVTGKANLSNATGALKVGKHALSNIKVTSPAGTGRMAVGAVITFDANQVTGVYSGSFVIRMTL